MILHSVYSLLYIRCLKESLAGDGAFAGRPGIRSPGGRLLQRRAGVDDRAAVVYAARRGWKYLASRVSRLNLPGPKIKTSKEAIRKV
jgi:hypothetical protein